MTDTLPLLPDPFTGLLARETLHIKPSLTWTQAVVSCLGDDARTIDDIVAMLETAFARFVGQSYGTLKVICTLNPTYLLEERRVNLRAKVRQVLNDLWHHDHFGVKGKRYLNVQVGRTKLYSAGSPEGVVAWYVDPVCVGE